MKTKLIVFTTITLLLLIGGMGCEKENADNDTEVNIKGTYGNWTDLAIQDNSVKNADPENCEDCFVVTFNADRTFTGKSIINRLAKNYYLSRNNLSFLMEYLRLWLMKLR